MALVLALKEGESIYIGHNCEVVITLARAHESQPRIAVVTANPKTPVDRRNLRIRKEQSGELPCVLTK